MAVNTSGSSGAGARDGDNEMGQGTPSNVHPRSSADETDSAAAAVQGDSGVAANFISGTHRANPTVEIRPGVWGDGFCKSG